MNSGNDSEFVDEGFGEAVNVGVSREPSFVMLNISLVFGFFQVIGPKHIQSERRSNIIRGAVKESKFQVKIVQHLLVSKAKRKGNPEETCLPRNSKEIWMKFRKARPLWLPSLDRFCLLSQISQIFPKTCNTSNFGSKLFFSDDNNIEA